MLENMGNITLFVILGGSVFAGVVWIAFLCESVKAEEDRKDFLEMRMRQQREEEEKRRKRRMGAKGDKADAPDQE